MRDDAADAFDYPIWRQNNPPCTAYCARCGFRAWDFARHCPKIGQNERDIVTVSKYGGPPEKSAADQAPEEPEIDEVEENPEVEEAAESSRMAALLERAGSVFTYKALSKIVYAIN